MIITNAQYIYAGRRLYYRFIAIANLSHSRLVYAAEALQQSGNAREIARLFGHSKACDSCKKDT
jgi:hypothetical protein